MNLVLGGSSTYRILDKYRKPEIWTLFERLLKNRFVTLLQKILIYLNINICMSQCLSEHLVLFFYLDRKINWKKMYMSEKVILILEDVLQFANSSSNLLICTFCPPIWEKNDICVPNSPLVWLAFSIPSPLSWRIRSLAKQNLYCCKGGEQNKIFKFWAPYACTWGCLKHI